jgi:hypothetical protein
MNLAMLEEYKGKVIYVNLNNHYYVVYDDGGDPVVREAIRLFTKNDIDINMPIYAYMTSECLIKNHIDVDEIISRGEQRFGLHSWI